MRKVKVSDEEEGSSKDRKLVPVWTGEACKDPNLGVRDPEVVRSAFLD